MMNHEEPGRCFYCSQKATEAGRFRKSRKLRFLCSQHAEAWSKTAYNGETVLKAVPITNSEILERAMDQL